MLKSIVKNIDLTMQFENNNGFNFIISLKIRNNEFHLNEFTKLEQ